jgi:tetratricopeptide (TPR) repeat protein
MRIPKGHGPRAGLILLILFLMAPVDAFGGEDQDLFDAFRGVVFDLLADFRKGDEAARQQASATLLGRGDFALPYVLVAAQATEDEEYRSRLLALAAEMRARVPERSLVKSFRGGGDLPGFSEYPPYDVVASNLVKNRWRADAVRLALFARPPTPEAALIHIHEERWGAALECLIAFARARPERIEKALEVARWGNICNGATLADRMAVLEAMATRIQKSASPGRASLIAFHLANLLRPDRKSRLEAVVEAFGDEEGGLRAQNELIEDSGRPGRERIAEQIALAAKHPGAKASRLGLENALFQLSNVNLISKDFNSLARLRELAAVATVLTGEQFAGGEGSFKAAEHIASFYISKDITPEEAKVMLAAYRVFFIHHFLADALANPAVTIDYYLKSKFTRLHGVLGVPKEAIDPVVLKELEEIERKVPEKAPVRCFIALYLAGQGRIDEAVAIFEELGEKYPDRFYGRKALAAQATLLYAQDKFAEAGELYARYAREHGTSAYAWVAALRAGHARAMTGAFDQATAAWERARAAFPGHPLVSVLVPLSLGRVFEEKGALPEALAQYRAALKAWPLDCDDRLGTPLMGIGRVKSRPYDAEIGRDELLEKVSELDRPGIDPAELSLHLKAKRLLEKGDAAGAVGRWQEFLKLHPASPLLPEVKAVLGQTLIETALTAPSREQAERSLVLAAARGDRFAAFAVDLFRSITDLGMEGGTEVARERLGKAFETWERGTVFEEPKTALHEDVAKIRRQVFRPRDNAFFTRGYDPDRWPRYSVITPEIDLTFPDGGRETVSLRHSFPEVKGVIYFTRDELSFITKIIDSLGGSKRSKPQSIMALPKPEGSAKAISKLLNDFIRLTPGHWGGWHLGTYPILTCIRFLDARRTGAIVDFRVRYQGGEAAVERVESGWSRTEVKFTWME